LFPSTCSLEISVLLRKNTKAPGGYLILLSR
jgi:hypothetical protein